MTLSRWEQDPHAVAESESFYSFIGKYIICFQWLEGKLDEIILLARGHDDREKTLHLLARKSNEQKIDLFYSVVTAGEPFGPVPIPDWESRLISARDRLHEERRRRNGLLHAQFLFDFLAIGAPIMRTHVRRQSERPVFDREDLPPERRGEIMTEIALLSFEMGMIFTQLIHVYRPPADRISGSV